MIYTNPSINVEGPNYDKLKSKVKGLVPFEAALVDGYLEYAIIISKEERNSHEQVTS